MNPNRIDLFNYNFQKGIYTVARMRHAIFCRTPDNRKVVDGHEHISCAECDWFYWRPL